MSYQEKIINEEIDIKPLTVNKVWQGRRFKTKAYKSYETELLYLLPTQSQVKGEVAVTLEFWLKYSKTTDIDNLVKPILDIIVKKGWISDDKMIYELHLHKYPAKKDKIRITISNV